uniref:Sodium/nucleoside cotransporter n=1 Tax=Strigops habroptila TaxID=2489341 RepID=A0A672VAT2_STRHB
WGKEQTEQESPDEQTEQAGGSNNTWAAMLKLYISQVKCFTRLWIPPRDRKCLRCRKCYSAMQWLTILCKNNYLSRYRRAKAGSCLFRVTHFSLIHYSEFIHRLKYNYCGEGKEYLFFFRMPCLTLLFPRVLCAALIIAVICWLIFDTAKQGSHQLISFCGLAMYVLLMFIFSKYPTRVAWRPVFSGIAMQFILGLLILRTKVGFDVFNWLGIQTQTFLEYSDTGAKFVFGEKYMDHFFAFKVLPIVVFFSTVMSMLYHIGFMQWLVGKVGWIMQIFMGTTPVESLVAAGNVFVGQTESPLLVRPYLPHITKSELHAVMTAGFSTIAGSVLGAYISFGVSASHLLTASVMSAPASLATSKLFWPETEKPTVTLSGESKNLLEAASHGASTSILLVANIAVNLISFLALLAFLDSALSWVGSLFDYPQLNFENICAYAFMPLSFMMGVDWEDSFVVGGLLGYKTFFNEFVAYERLSQLIHNREKGGSIKSWVRSEVIATYALCGFANFGSLGLVIGGLTSLAPSKKKEIAGGAFRAMIAGTVACFMTACVAGTVPRFGVSYSR